MAKRIKTIPAIELNAGLKAALQKRLIALIENPKSRISEL